MRPARALEERVAAGGGLRVVFRDDDVGWADAALWPMLDVFARAGVVVDLAVIPAALTGELSRELRARVEAGEVKVHQHGFAHVNHETALRKCEFGPARGRAEQRRDIEAGARILEEHFGPTWDRIFTPPWNRCTEDTLDCLAGLGFTAISRAEGARPAARGVEIPVTFDWSKVSRSGGDPWAALSSAVHGNYLCVMTHHADMTGADNARLSELLGWLAGRRDVALLTMAGAAAILMSEGDNGKLPF